MRLRTRLRIRHAVAALLLAPPLLLAILLLLDRRFPPDLHRARAASLLLLDRDDRLLDGRTAVDGAWRFPATRAAVDPAYLALLLRTEDRRFFLHPGVDPLALVRAAFQLLTRGHVVSGGSTLAMQTARLLAPHRHDLSGKLRDALRALQLEWRFGRAGVLDLYLSLAPEGGNIEGIRAASLLWFDHPPAHLSPAEAALLVALPRRPAALRPDRHPAAAARAAARLLPASAIPPGPAALPATFHPRPLPHDAPELLSRSWHAGARDLLRTTLDATLQRNARRLLFAAALPPRGTAAALLVRPDATVAAWLGHAGNSCPGCDADMVSAPRSPGSALKPFLYGLAFQRGILTPDTLLPDSAARFGRYAPQDYDRSFRGAVSAATALQRSLNLPAVRILSRLGPASFAAALAAGGAPLRLPPGASPSLALALGGAGIRMLDLARLYHALATGGLSRPLSTIPPPADRFAAPPRPPPPRLLTPRAAAAVLALLRGTPPPPELFDAATGAGGAFAPRSLSFKTGTSYGQRDAWAAGMRNGWTVVAWAGRPDGTASPGITGLGTAAPLMARLFDLLPAAPPTPDATPDAATTGTTQASLSPALRALPSHPGPRIVFPPDGAALESLDPDGTAVPIALQASGGTEPYRWLVDGAPLPIPLGTDPSWRPAGPGFAHLAVVDAAGRAAAATVRVR